MIKFRDSDFYLARHLYERYSEHTGGKSVVTGDPLPDWMDLGTKIQEAWAAAARAAIAVQPEATVIGTDYFLSHFETRRDMEALQEEATATEPHDYTPAMQRLQSLPTVRLLHAALGLVTEAAEFADILKAHIYYGKPVDFVHVEEEIGDVSWYSRVAADTINAGYLEIMLKNVRKLKTRYKNGFTEQAAQVRDLDKEQEVLKQKP